MDRPKLSQGEVRDILIGAKFASDEAKLVNAALKGENTDKSKWIRKILLSAAAWLNSIGGGCPI